MRYISTTRFATLLLAFAALAAQGQAPAPGPGPRNVYSFGGEVRPAQAIRGDLVAAGGHVVVDQPVGGDAALAGGSVDVRASVGDDLRVTGGSISLESRVGGDLVAAGADVSLRSGAAVAGAADLSAANILVQGRIDGALRGRAQKIVIDGEVHGPAHLAGERIELGPKARLMGPLTYVSSAGISRAEGAMVQGPVTHEAPGAGGRSNADPALRSAAFGASGAVVAWIALFAFASALLLLMPAFTAGAAARLRASPWAALGIGVASLVALPIVVLLLFITILGIPLGLALTAAYPVALLAGFVVAVVAVTGAVVSRRRTSAGTAAAGPGRPGLGHVALGLGAVLLLGLVPVAGALFISLLGLAGLGATVLHLRVRGGTRREGAASGELPLPGHDVFPA